MSNGLAFVLIVILFTVAQYMFYYQSKTSEGRITEIVSQYEGGINDNQPK